ncbi:hypothetical protein LWI29_015706 [Acer saccharum]|uniref:Mitochondrial glycoprotein n=1 Tax=Acer saccharum TaxID=4024 RepID=A0AA39SSL7_ACESA|nr:hypothetical protein LWI29_015706 [Acer saccharum]
MPRVSPILSKGLKAIEDLNLLKILHSEINHELSSNRFQSNQSGPLEGFEVEYDAPQSQDVVLRKKCESGEEVAVSALLGPETFAREVVEKQVSSEFYIQNAHYLQSSPCPRPTAYRGPIFCTLDPQLQESLEEYLLARGIGEKLTNFLLLHLHKKELDQYVNWLRTLVSFVEKDG